MTRTDIWDEWTQSEEPALNLFRDRLGYKYIDREHLESERISLRDVVLYERLQAALRRLNPWLSDDNLRRAAREFTHVAATSLMEANERIHDLLVNYWSVEQDLGKGKRHQTVKFIDWDDVDNNEFLVTNQFKVAGDKDTIIPDIVVFVNGIPLAVIECKNPKLADPIGEAVKQLIRYQDVAERLFYTNQILVATCGQAAKAGAILAKGQHYAEWKDPWPKRIDDLGPSPTPQDILLAGMFEKQNFLDLIRNFIVFEREGGKVIKKVARYQQFRAVNKAIDRILKAKTPKERGGVVWHTQGSGKSLTMVYLAMKLRRLAQLGNPTILIVTDRRDLDKQITGTFQHCKFPNPQQADSVKHLRSLLTSGAGYTVMTTVQKFQEREADEHPELSDSSNIFVLVDEAHRTEYGDLATNMHTALPKATFLAFTGTPIDKQDKSTLKTFGPYIDKYTIQQAVADGATVPIFYEGRLPEVKVEGESLDAIFDRWFRDYSDEERAAIKKKFATEEAVTSSPRRIRQICVDLLEHYEKHIQPNGMKAQIVAVNRETAVTYKEILDELGAPESAVIFSAGHNDEERLRKYHLSKSEQDALIERFKKPMHDDSLSILIVVDMLLTGFDAPVEQVLYVDKPLKEHNLLQAIARVNRTYSVKTDDFEYVKDYGLVIDYYGVTAFLKKALGIFEDADIKGAMVPLKEEVAKLEMYHKAAMRFFQEADKSDLNTCVLVLEPEDIRADFEASLKRFAKMMDKLMPNPVVNPYRKDLRFLSDVMATAKTRYRDETLDISGCGEKVRRLIEEHVYATGVGCIIKPISVFEKEFNYHVSKQQSDEAKASEMEHAIKHVIRIKLSENPAYYESLRERLEKLIKARKEYRLTTAQLILDLQEIIEEVRHAENAAARLGLSDTEFAVYGLLGKEMDPKGQFMDATKELAKSVTETIERLAVVDWQSKQDVQREMRKKVKPLLRAGRCPNEKIESLTQQLIDLAKVRIHRS